MNTMNNGTSWNDAVTINKQSGTKITLDTDSKFIAKDIELTINVQGGSAATPNTTITANPTLSINSSTGVVTSTVSTTESVTPTVSAGYVSAGSAGTMTVSGSNTLSLSTQDAQTIIPTTTDQTIESGKYLIGVQTIKGDADLIPTNIKNGVSIFNVTGTGMTNITLAQDDNGVIDIPKTTTDVNTITLQVKNTTPSASSQSIEPDTGYFGLSKVNISGDTNLIPRNIAKGVSIFGITGTHSGGLNDVNFRDYDGSIVASYSAADFTNLTVLPDNPDRTSEGLTAQGWNWTLANAKTYVATYGKLDIGQMYITTDGKTHVHIHLEQGRTSPMLGCCPNGTVDVDWGDGTMHDTLTGTSTSTEMWTPNHIYATPGDYVIKLTVSEGGSMGFYGNSSGNQYSGLLRYSSTSDTLNYAYRNAIRALFIGSGVTSIGSNAFSYCYSLSSVTIPNGVTNIESNAFSFCDNLSSVTIPSSMTSIETGAFYSCFNLSSVMISSSITSIGFRAFYYCYNLSNVTIPSGVTSIGDNTFYGCYSLSSVTIPSDVTSIGANAFYCCYSLSNVTIPNSVTSIGNNAFYCCYGLSSVTISSSVTSIGTNMFYCCYSLSSVTIPNGITSIGGNAFYACHSLSSVTIPSSVTSIEASAFYSCNSLLSVTVPSGVTSIGTNAFRNCYSFGELHFMCETPPTIFSSNTFDGIPTDCKIYVPTGSLSAYTSATNYPSSSTYTYIEE